MPRKLRTPLIATLEHFRAIVVTHGLSERDALAVIAAAQRYLELTDGEDLNAANLALLRGKGEQLASLHLDLVEEGATAEIQIALPHRSPSPVSLPPGTSPVALPPSLVPSEFDEEVKTETIDSPWNEQTQPKRKRPSLMADGSKDPALR